jgi:hypothetical protein
MLVGRYRLIAPGPPPAPAKKAPPKKDPRSLALALVFEDAPELHYLDDKRMGKVYVARAADEGTDPDLRPARRRRAGAGRITREAFGKLIARRRDQVRAFLMDKTRAGVDRQRLRGRDPVRGRHPPQDVLQQAGAAGRSTRSTRAIGRVLTDAIAEIRGATSRSRSRCATSSRCAAATASRASSAARRSAPCASATATPASARTVSARRASCSSTGPASTTVRVAAPARSAGCAATAFSGSRMAGQARGDGGSWARSPSADRRLARRQRLEPQAGHHLAQRGEEILRHLRVDALVRILVDDVSIPNPPGRRARAARAAASSGSRRRRK